MAVLSRSVYVLAAIDALFVAFITFLSFSFVAKTVEKQLRGTKRVI